MQILGNATTSCAGSIEDKTKRLTIDISEALHKALKIKAVNDGITMAEIVRQLLLRQFTGAEE
jgi:predicted DNA binding CopG/RHH family protein